MLASVVAVLVMAQNGSAPVTWDVAHDWKTPVVSLRHLASEISSRTGRRVEVAPDVADLNVYVNVREKSAAQVLDMVAYATTTRWSISEDNVTIQRSREDWEAEESRFAATKVRWIRSQLEKIPSSNLGATQQRDLLREAERLLGRLRKQESASDLKSLVALDKRILELIQAQDMAREIGAELLSTVRAGRPVVLSSHPTKYQRRVPGRAVELVAVTDRYLNLLEDVWRTHQWQEGRESGFTDFLTKTRKRSARTARLVISCLVEEDRAPLEIRVHAFDDQGDTIRSSRHEIPSQDAHPTEAEIAKFGQFPTTQAFSDALKTRMSLVGQALEGNFDFAKRRVGLQIVAQGEIGRNGVTPVSEALDACVKGKNDLVVEAPAKLFGYGVGTGDPRYTLADTFQFIEPELKTIHGARVGRLSAPWNRYDHYYPDAPLAVFAARLLKQEPINLEDFADAAAVCRTWIELERLPETLGRISTTASLPTGIDALIPLRAYGLLTERERERVRGQGISGPLPSFSAKFRDYIAALIEENRFVPGDHSLENGALPRYFRRNSPHPPRSNYEALSTVFRAMPGAYPIRVNMSLSRKPKLLFAADRWSPREYSPREAGQWQAIGELRAAAGTSTPGAPITRFAEVEASLVRLEVIFGEFNPSSISFPYARSEEIVFAPLAQMSEEMRREFEAGYTDWMNQQSGSQRAKPPPPSINR